ncbi:MAG: hexose kinase [Firmicutes bacterium]|nr:hexose kinase [Bacillota bacterium]
MKILTITLNPAYDVYCKISSFELYKENLIKSTFTSPGGKGVNISRAMTVYGIPTAAYIVFGRENCGAFENALNSEKVPYVPFYTDGRIRENYTVIPENAAETRICFDSFTAGPEILDSVLSRIETDADADDIIAFSGKFPGKIDRESKLRFLKKLKQLTKRLVIDTNSLDGKDIISLSPWLIKPNEQELEAFTGSRPSGLEDAANSAREIREAGVENVLVTLGGNGAAFAGKGIVITADAPKIDVLSSVGAGDSSISGFIAAFIRGEDSLGCFLNAVASGSAACLREGTAPPLQSDIEKLRPIIKLRTENI